MSYISGLVLQGILPVCGGRFPGVAPHFSTPCQDQGLHTGTSDYGHSLHLHHEPALTDLEQQDRAIVCDEQRIVLACDSCHNAIDPTRRHVAA